MSDFSLLKAFAEENEMGGDPGKLKYPLLTLSQTKNSRPFQTE